MSGRAESHCPEHALCPGWFSLPALVRLRVEAAPPWLREVKALFVTDVHLRRRVSDTGLSALIELLGSADANLLLLGGDYAESPEECRRFFRALSSLHFPLGAFAVPGNNDNSVREELRGIAETAGVTLLVNAVRRVQLPGGTLAIAGCDEYKYGTPRTRGLFPDDGSYRILLSHYPVLPDCECELMLSGHTHGGQLCLWGRSPYVLGYERSLHLAAVSGWHRSGEMRLLVSNGIGVSKLPLRLHAPAQVHCLEFVP